MRWMIVKWEKKTMRVQKEEEKIMSKKLDMKKKISIFFSVILMGVLIIAPTNTVAHASDVKSSAYSLYYNSKQSCRLSQVCKVTYYAGTNYFKCSSISGSASVILVDGDGYNVSLNRALTATKVTTIRFVPSLNASAKDRSNTIITVSMSYSGGDTAYASGKIYF